MKTQNLSDKIITSWEDLAKVSGSLLAIEDVQETVKELKKMMLSIWQKDDFSYTSFKNAIEVCFGEKLI